MGIQQYYIDKKIKKALKRAAEIKLKNSLSIINKIAIFVDEESLFDEKEYRNLQRLIKRDETHFSIVTIKKKKTSFNEFRGVVVVENDINWQGRITSKEVISFLNNKYDLLIDYTLANTKEKQLIVSIINASFKVGYINEKEELYDFMIDVSRSKIALFNKEMVHYLAILELI